MLVFVFSLSDLIAQDKKFESLKAILEKSRKKILSIQAASYKAFYKSDQERDDTATIIKADVLFKKLSGVSVVQSKIEGQWLSPDTVFFANYYDGDKEITVSPRNKQVKVFNRPAMLEGNIMGQLVDTILLSEEPFDGTLERMSDFKMQESKMIGGEPCYVFTLYFSDNEYLTDISTTWYISKNNYLPRKYVKQAKFNGKKDIRTIQFKDLIVNPKLPDSLFVLSPFPEGYEIEWPEDRAKEKKPKLLKPGIEAPDWMLKTTDSTKVSLSDYRGQIVIIDFWGTWCLPCLEAMPELQRIHEKYNEVTVLGVSTNEPANAEPEKFARNRNINYPILLDGEKIIHKYNVQSYPTFYIIDKDGKIIYRSEGYGGGTGKKIEEVLGNYIDQ